MRFIDALFYYRCYSHSYLTSMLNDSSYYNSLSCTEQDGLYAAWEEFYYAV